MLDFTRSYSASTRYRCTRNIPEGIRSISITAMCVVIAFRIPRFRRRLMGNDLARGCSTDGDTNTTRMCCCFGSDWTKSSALCVSPGFNHTTKQMGLVVKHVLRQNPFQRLGRDLAISKRFFLLLTSETHEIRYSGNPRHIHHFVNNRVYPSYIHIITTRGVGVLHFCSVHEQTAHAGRTRPCYSIGRLALRIPSRKQAGMRLLQL